MQLQEFEKVLRVDLPSAWLAKNYRRRPSKRIANMHRNNTHEKHANSATINSDNLAKV
jgi:hypothetical protein